MNINHLLHRKGYTAADDTWEPLENVAFTGHVDRYVRKDRALQFQNRSRGRNTPGTALIEYDDGEKEWVDLTQEKFLVDIGSNPPEDTDRIEVGEIDWTLIHIGANIKLLWEYADIYFPAEILDWEPLNSTNKKLERKPSLIGSTEFRGKTMCIPNQENKDEDNLKHENADNVSAGSPPLPPKPLLGHEVERTEESLKKVVSDETSGDMLDDSDVLSLESKSSVETKEVEVTSVQSPKSSAARAAAATSTKKNACFNTSKQDNPSLCNDTAALATDIDEFFLNSDDEDTEEIEITSVQSPKSSAAVALAATSTKNNACFNTSKRGKPALTAALATNIDEFFLNSDDEGDGEYEH